MRGVWVDEYADGIPICDAVMVEEVFCRSSSRQLAARMFVVAGGDERERRQGAERDGMI